MPGPLEASTPTSQAGYYGLPILKKPFWKWEIALYFFSEGVSSGCYILSTVASVIGNGRLLPIVRYGRYLSFLFLLPCPPLLIADLGRPERFHHMLRIFKKTSPMNHGAWALSGYGVFSTLQVMHELPVRRIPLAGAWIRLAQRTLPARIVRLLGMPFALTMVSYPGVLLSTTSIPVWSHSHFLGALLACSSIGSAASALTLCSYASKQEEVHNALTRLEDVTSAAEALALSAYLVTARKATRPLLRGKQSKLFIWGAIVAGLIAPLLLRRSRSKVLRSGLAPLLTLAGSLALKLSVTYAGQESALDVKLAVHNSPDKTGEPFWGGKTSRAIPAAGETRFQTEYPD